MGEDLARTCHESYVRTPTGLGPDYFSFGHSVEAKSRNRDDPYVAKFFLSLSLYKITEAVFLDVHIHGMS